jgi:DnaK suppressor protein
MSRGEVLIRLTSRLIARRDALRKVLAEEVSRLREPSEIVGYGDHMDAAVDSANDEICSRMAEIESRELTEIEQALCRIAEGHYGHCASCGSRIPAARLNALPYTTRCIACQRRDEMFSRSDVDDHDEGRWESVDEGPYFGGSDTAMSFEDYSIRIESPV